VFSFLSAFSIFFFFFLRFSTIIGLEEGLSLLVFDMKKFVSRKRKIFSESRWCERPRRENFFFPKKGNKKRERERDFSGAQKSYFFLFSQNFVIVRERNDDTFQPLSREIVSV